MSSDIAGDSISKYVSLKQIRECGGTDKLKARETRGRTKLKEKCISNEIKKVNKKCRMNDNKPYCDLFSKFKVFFCFL